MKALLPIIVPWSGNRRNHFASPRTFSSWPSACPRALSLIWFGQWSKLRLSTLLRNVIQSSLKQFKFISACFRACISQIIWFREISVPATFVWLWKPIFRRPSTPKLPTPKLNVFSHSRIYFQQQCNLPRIKFSGFVGVFIYSFISFICKYFRKTVGWHRSEMVS